MPAPPIVRKVYAEHIARFGEPSRSVAYDGSNALTTPPLQRVDIFVWRPTGDLDITTFSTIGMAARTMPGNGTRAELHLAIRGALSESEEGELTRILANLAAYPWTAGAGLGYWHAVQMQLPGFPSCSWMMIHPAFTEGGWESIEWGDEKVKIFNLVPITDAEHTALREGPSVLWRQWQANNVDVFSRR